MRSLSLFLIATAGLFAQADSWALLRGIYPGQHTHVHLLSGDTQTGGFISTTDANIVIRLRTGDQTLAKEQIQKISVRKLSKRGRNALIGAGIGAGVMGGLAAGLTGDGTFAAAAAVGYGIIGAGIGALFPGYDTLYRAPRK
jgi:hypothetical protein